MAATAVTDRMATGVFVYRSSITFTMTLFISIVLGIMEITSCKRLAFVMGGMNWTRASNSMRNGKAAIIAKKDA
jgi:hypothetical protein